MKKKRFCIFSSKLTSKFSDMKKIYFTPNEGSLFMSIYQYTSNAYWNPKGQISDDRWHDLHLLPRFWQGKCHITCFKTLAQSWQGIEPRSSACEANALARERDSNTGHYISSIANLFLISLNGDDRFTHTMITRKQTSMLDRNEIDWSKKDRNIHFFYILNVVKRSYSMPSMYTRFLHLTSPYIIQVSTSFMLLHLY